MSTGGKYKYKTAAELELAVEDYFASCKPTPILDASGAPVLDGNGNQTWERHPPTITGLTLALGFESRVSLYEQTKRGARFHQTLARAKMRIEEYHEGLLSTKTQCTGSIFFLKNHGWIDEQSISGGQLPLVTAALSLSEAEEKAYRENFNRFFGRDEGR